MDSNYFFKMYSNCIVSKGVNRSLILDLQTGTFNIIPPSLHEIINDLNNKKSIAELYKIYGEDNIETIQEYLEYLIENDFGFLTEADEFDLFIDFDRKWEIASNISNCIIELSKCNLSFSNKIIDELESLYCKNIQFVCFQEIKIDNLKQLLELTAKSSLRSVELVLKYSQDLLGFLTEINNNYRVSRLTFHSLQNEKIPVQSVGFEVNFINHEINSFTNCGIVDISYFNVNKDMVLESLNHNTCLNRKISIDMNGNIKNCPSMPESFGNIKDTTLAEALNHPNFKKYWHITKDQIEVCKDCEFRHICTDCRAYVEDPENDYSKPLKCGYNPYTNVWEEWSSNPLKQKAIEYYGMQDLVKKNG
ncbi:MAG: grasp-with-spasm system SPASM domain peptide maturase [Flavobacterium sp. BFFFF2]|nr:MAG: grasp-with-spasm system SPASM domain peptide maturase [Flavobacterium sp. BFFFF2]